MTPSVHTRLGTAAIAENAVRELMRASHSGAASFIDMPLLFPDGSAVTIKLEHVEGGIRVSDNGFAYRALEAVGAQRSFSKTAASVASAAELSVDRRKIFVDILPEFAAAAICEVAAASWLVTERVFQRLPDEEDEEIKGHLLERLALIFPNSLIKEPNLKGASTHEWPLTAVVHVDGHATVFQAVTNHMQSVNKASTGFLDLANLPNPPRLVAVVKDRDEMAEKLLLLSQAGGRVIEQSQSDEVYLRAAR